MRGERSANLNLEGLGDLRCSGLSVRLLFSKGRKRILSTIKSLAHAERAECGQKEHTRRTEPRCESALH